MTTVIVNPIRKGDLVTIPAGTLTRSMNPRHDRLLVAKTTRQVIVSNVTTGWVDSANIRGEGRGYVVLPTLTWPGSGGYWQTAQVTPDLLKANTTRVLARPDLSAHEEHNLDVIPSTDPGYTDQWKAPQP